MSNPTVSGQSLIDSLKIQLGALSNAFDTDELLYFTNEGVSEVWTVIRSLDLDFFTASSQDSSATDDNYFVDLSTTAREYDLPKNCREIRAIECTTAGFTDRIFEYRKFDHVDFMNARREATSSGLGFSGGKYFYTIFGNQIMLAQFPEAVLQLKLWYVKAIDDIGTGDIPEILFPFSKKITDYATKKAILSTQNLEMAAAWKIEWAEGVKMLAISVGPRESTNPIFIDDFLS